MPNNFFDSDVHKPICEDDKLACVNIRKYFHIEFWQNFMLEALTREEIKQIARERIFKNIFADFRGIVVSNETCCKKMNDVGKECGYTIDDKLRFLLSGTERYESMASYALGGRVLYMSTLGSQAPEWPDMSISPLEFVMYVQQGTHPKKARALRGVNRWQLGRLMDRLHLIGTVRLASLKSLPSLRRVGVQLSFFDPVVKNAREAISENEANTADNMKDHMKAVHRDFAEMTKRFDKDTGTISGIMYRVERSMYYVKQFYKNLQGLRLTRLEGYQRHDHFVERRLGLTFDFIDRLGRRYERAMNSILALDQYYLTTQANYINTAVRDIQKYGEVILFAFPVPYYASALVERTFIDQVSEPITIIIWTVSVAYAFASYVEAKKYSPHRRGFIKWSVAIVMCVIMSIGWIVLYRNGILNVFKETISYQQRQRHGNGAQKQGDKQSYAQSAFINSEQHQLLVNNNLNIQVLVQVEEASNNGVLHK